MRMQSVLMKACGGLVLSGISLGLPVLQADEIEIPSINKRLADIVAKVLEIRKADESSQLSDLKVSFEESATTNDLSKIYLKSSVGVKKTTWSDAASQLDVDLSLDFTEKEIGELPNPEDKMLMSGLVQATVTTDTLALLKAMFDGEVGGSSSLASDCEGYEGEDKFFIEFCKDIDGYKDAKKLREVYSWLVSQVELLKKSDRPDLWSKSEEKVFEKVYQAVKASAEDELDGLEVVFSLEGSEVTDSKRILANSFRLVLTPKTVTLGVSGIVSMTNEESASMRNEIMSVIKKIQSDDEDVQQQFNFELQIYLGFLENALNSN